MEKIKTILDRQPLSSEYIRSKQDFGKVMKGTQGTNTPIWKSSWFYGTVGVATVAIIVTAVTLTSSDTPKKPDTPKKQVMASNIEGTDSSTDKVFTQGETPSDNVEAPVDTEARPTVSEIPAENPTPRVTPQEQEEPNPAFMARQTPDPEPEVSNELQLPNIAGVTGGPIAFRDFCDPIGIQVGEGVLIYSYTIQYRSCARDVTARINGNLIPQVICNEIQDCGSNIEVTFSKIKARDRNNNAVQLKDFTLVATM